MSVMERQASGVDPAVLAALDRFYDACRAVNVQVAFLLTRKACVGQILCGGARSNSHVDVI